MPGLLFDWPLSIITWALETGWAEQGIEILAPERGWKVIPVTHCAVDPLGNAALWTWMPIFAAATETS